MNNDASWAEEECGVAVGRAVCRAKWHFALFGVPSVQTGQDGLFVGRSGTSPSLRCSPCRRVMRVRALSKFIRPDGAGRVCPMPHS